MSTQLDKLNLKRSTTRGSLTKLFNTTEDDLQKDGTDTMVLEKHLGQLQRLEQDLTKLDLEIEDLVDIKSLQEELLSVEEYRERITNCKIELEARLRKARDCSDTSTSSSRRSGTVDKLIVNLPRLNINKYQGDPSQWLSFWGQYDAAIDGNSSLNKVEKFSYLNSFLEGAASSAIAGLPLTADNYDAAIKILKDRFGRKDLIISAHMNNLLALESVKRSTDVEALRRLYDSCEVQVRSLESMGVVSETYGSLLCPVLLKLIPVDIALEISKQREEDADWKVTRILTLLRKDIESRERTLYLTKALNSEAAASKPFKKKSEGSNYKMQFPERLNKPCSAAALNISASLNCMFCNSSDHTRDECEALTVNDKKEIAKKQGRCFVCLKRGHTARACRYKGGCTLCKGRHHKTICDFSTSETSVKTSTLVASINNDEECKLTTFLQTAQAVARGSSKTVVRCLLDSGSQRTFIREDVSKQLGLPVTGTETLNIRVFGQNEPTRVTRKRVKISLYNIADPHQSVEIEALESPQICSGTMQMPSQEIQNMLKSLGLRGAENPTIRTATPGQLTIIIGADYYWKIVSGKTKRLNDSLVAVETIFGWSVHGSAVVSNSAVVSSITTNVFKVAVETEEELVSTQLKRFWELDSIGITEAAPSETISNNEIIKSFETSVKFRKDRYVVRLPWKDEMKDTLQDNYCEARKRFEGLSKRFKRDPVLFTQYKDVIQDYLNKGFIEEVEQKQTKVENDNPVFFMPHRAVIKNERATTKLRIVFDASSHSKGHPSLNDCLHSGPNLNPDLFDVLIRFREYPIAFTADIEQAFLQIELAEEDRDVTRFLWLDESLSSDTDSKLKVFRFTRIPFGITSSPFLLASTLRYHIEKNECTFPETCTLLENSLYVDDLIAGTNSIEGAVSNTSDAREIMRSAGMSLRKWQTNSNELKELWVKQNQETETPVHFVSSEACQMKVLGITWDPEKDKFYFDVSQLLNFLINRIDTKRFVLQAAGRIFDPIGFLSPFTIRVKCLFQELWTEGVEWDSTLSGNIRYRWNSWCLELKILSNIGIPRCYIDTGVYRQATKYQLHCFSDASAKAYGAVLYLRFETSYCGISTSFVCSKARVAPLKTLTIPRLELMGAILASRLSKKVISCLNVQVTCRFWTDSMIVYYWIRSSSERYKPFVQNRVKEIQHLTEPSGWSYCPGSENPADLATRGLTLTELENSVSWWCGPQWLRKSEENWPKVPVATIDSNSKELRKNYQDTIQFACSTNLTPKSLLDLTKYSSLHRIVRVIAWIYRFLWNVKHDVKERQGALTFHEIDLAENYWLKTVQQEYYINEISSLKNGLPLQTSKTFGLNPYLDENGLLRVGGRIEQSDLPYQTKHPIILPANAKFTNLLIMTMHEKTMHSGVAATLALIRNKYWIIRGRQAVKKVIRSCLICRKFSAKPAVEISAPLPKERIQASKPFHTTGVDYAGPLQARARKGTEKCYILIFTCAVTRAVHLELVTDLSTDKFLLALRRFLARRGTCLEIISDNAKTFKRAEKEIFELWKISNNPEVQDIISQERITWKFNAEKAAWWGGFFERIVRSVKTCLRKQLGKALLSFEELTTILSEVEAILNSRPLSFTYNDINEPEPITPAQFLTGCSSLITPPHCVGQDAPLSTKEELTKRKTYRERLLKRLWDHWQKEYLLELRSAHFLSSLGKGPKVKENEIVLIKEDKTPRLIWKQGLVTKVFPGRDGKIRSCLIKTGNGRIIRRPVQLLYPLEL